MQEITTQGIEHTQLKGLTIKNMIVTILCTASIVGTILGTFYGLRNDYALMDLRLKVAEAQITIINQQLSDLRNKTK